MHRSRWEEGPGCATNWLCDPGQVAVPFWASSPQLYVGLGSCPSPGSRPAATCSVSLHSPQAQEGGISR